MNQGWEEWEKEECMAESSKPKRNREERRGAKRAKMDNNDGVAWGEEIPEGVAEIESFQYNTSKETGMVQSEVG